MEAATYLARIGAARPPAPTSAALRALHRAHTRSVPFEDYDIHTGTPISLQLPDIHDKIVRRRSRREWLTHSRPGWGVQ